MGVPTPRGLTKVKNSCERPTMKASDWLNMCCDKNLGSDWPEAFDLSLTFVFRPLRQAPTLILPDGWEDYAPLVPRTILALKSKPESTPKLVLPAPVMEIPEIPGPEPDRAADAVPKERSNAGDNSGAKAPRLRGPRVRTVGDGSTGCSKCRYSSSGCKKCEYRGS